MPCFFYLESSIKIFETVTLIDILQIWEGVFIAAQFFPPQSLAPHRATVILLKAKPAHATLLFQTTHCFHGRVKTKVLRWLTRHHTIPLAPTSLSSPLLCAPLPVFEHLQAFLYLRAFAPAVPQPGTRFAPSSWLPSDLNPNVTLSGRSPSTVLHKIRLLLSPLFVSFLWTHQHLTYDIGSCAKMQSWWEEHCFVCHFITSTETLKALRSSINSDWMLKETLPKGFSSIYFSHSSMYIYPSKGHITNILFISQVIVFNVFVFF